MKKHALLLVTSLLGIGTLVGCNQPGPEQITIIGANEWGVNGVTNYKASVEGTTWASSNNQVATIDENGKLVALSAGKTTLTASKEGYADGVLEVTIVAHDISFTKEQYGAFFGEFNGVKASLNIQPNSMSIKEGDNTKVYYPTEIKTEQFNYTTEDKTTAVESYGVIYYGTKFNDNNYRIRFNEQEFKNVIFEKQVGEGYEEVYSFIPSFHEYVGSFNFGFAEEQYDINNYVYLYSDEYVVFNEKLGLGGYPVRTYYASNSTLLNSADYNIPGYETVVKDGKTTYVKAFKTIGSRDFEYYTTILTYNGNNLAYFSNGELVDYAYPDASIFLTDVVTLSGELENSYTVEEVEEYVKYKLNPVVNGDAATLEVSRDEKGLIYTFKVTEENKYVVRLGADKFEYEHGNEKSIFAPVTTFYGIDDGVRYWEKYELVNHDKSQSFEYWTDTDWDTWEDVPVIRLNGVDITDGKLVPNKNGKAFYSFTANNVNYQVERVNENIAILHSGDKEENMFSISYINKRYNHELINIKEQLDITYANFKVTEGTTEYNAEVVLDETFDRVAIKYNDKEIIVLDDDLGLYVLLEGDNLVSLVKKSKIAELNGTYTSDGVDSVKFENGKLFINEEEITYELGYIINASAGIFLSLTFKDGARELTLVPYFNGVVLELEEQLDGSYKQINAFFDKTVTDTFVGKYYYDSKYGQEYVEFTSNYKLFATDLIDEQLVRVEHEYAFGKASTTIDETEYEYYQLLMAYEGYNVPFTKMEYALYINALNIMYVQEGLYLTQGVYSNKDANVTVSVYENNLYYSEPNTNKSKITSNLLKINSVEVKDNKVTINATQSFPNKTLTITGDVVEGAVTNLTLQDSTKEDTLTLAKVYSRTELEGLLTKEYRYEAGSYKMGPSDYSFGPGKLYFTVGYNPKTNKIDTILYTQDDNGVPGKFGSVGVIGFYWLDNQLVMIAGTPNLSFYMLADGTATQVPTE